MSTTKRSEPQRNPTISKSKTRGVHLIPNTVACEGTTTLALIFDEIPDLRGTGKVEVSFRSAEKTDTIVATPVNQQSFRLVAPENLAGEVPVVVFVGGVEVTSTWVNYVQESVHLVTGVAQVHLQLLTRLCRYIRRTPSPMAELDRCLSEWFEDKEDANKIQPKVFEELFDILRHSPSDMIRSPHEFPTLLHFTAEFGLTKLAERLMDLPGAERASQVRNAEGLTASTIALRNKYDTLRTILGRKREAIREKNTPVVKPSQTDGQYVKPDAFDDNYDIIMNPKSSPPQPIARPAQPSKLSPRTSAAQLPTPPTSSTPPPGRKSRDSGFDAWDDTVPSLSAQQRRQAFTRGHSEQSSASERSNRLVLEPGRSQDSSSRPAKLSERDILLQLSRPVFPNSRAKGSPFPQ